MEWCGNGERYDGVEWRGDCRRRPPTVTKLGVVVARCLSGTGLPYDRLCGIGCVEVVRYSFMGRGLYVHVTGSYGFSCDWKLEGFMFASVVSEKDVTVG